MIAVGDSTWGETTINCCHQYSSWDHEVALSSIITIWWQPQKNATFSHLMKEVEVCQIIFFFFLICIHLFFLGDYLLTVAFDTFIKKKNYNRLTKMYLKKRICSVTLRFNQKVTWDLKATGSPTPAEKRNEYFTVCFPAVVEASVFTCVQTFWLHNPFYYLCADFLATQPILLLVYRLSGHITHSNVCRLWPHKTFYYLWHRPSGHTSLLLI